MTFRKIAIAAALFSAVTGGDVALAAADDFQSFWQAFSMAAAKNDQAFLLAMTTVPHAVVEDHKSFFHAKARACLAKAKPKKEADGYMVFCDGGIYIFSKKDATWRFADYSPDD